MKKYTANSDYALSLSLPAQFASSELLKLTAGIGIPTFLDFHFPRLGEITATLSRLQGKLNIRLFQATQDVLGEAIHSPPNRVKFYIEAGQAKTEGAQKLFATGAIAGVVVHCLQEIEEAADYEGIKIIGRGNEAGGLSGPLSTFVLFQLLRRNLGNNFILEGGLDLPAAVAAVAAGASGAVLGAACWGFQECGRALSEVALQFRGPDSVRLSDKNGWGFRFGCRNQPNLEALRRSICEISIDQWPEKLPPDHLPVGQDVEFARRNVTLYDDLGNFLKQARNKIEKAQMPSKLPGLGCAMAMELGTKYPIVQGPMARVSVNSNFLKVVADSGALPVLSFSNLDIERCREIFQEVKRLDLHPAVGLNALKMFESLLDSQIEFLKNDVPPFVWVGAPQPAVVSRLVKEGFQVVSHLPIAGMLSSLRETECRIFVVEGSESGGHIGKYTSLILWQQVLNEICERGWQDDIRLLFAGGIALHGGFEFIAALVESYGLTDRLNWGIQLGTAYLATREIVETGAVSRNYRNWVLNSDVTLITGETVGLRVRQVASPFVEEILEKEETMLRIEISLTDRREAFEGDNVGNLSRAVASNEGEDGCFMAGEVVAVLDRILSIKDLHKEIIGDITPLRGSNESRSLSARSASSLAPAVAAPSIIEPIAVIGIGCAFPESPDPITFFQNLLAKRCFIKPIPADRLDREIYFGDNPTKPFTTQSQIGAFIDDLKFEPMQYGIPESTADKMDPEQKLALICARQALVDAGYLEKKIDRESFSVIIGTGIEGIAHAKNLRYINFHEFLHSFRKSVKGMEEESIVLRAMKKFKTHLHTQSITEDSLNGEMKSQISGRISAVFDLHGPNFTIDAECASSLTAVSLAVNALRRGECKLALAGGVDMHISTPTFLTFSQAKLLSATGSFPYDHRGDGMVLGEGGGLILLKKLSNALNDGDRIYSVILGTGQFSCGKTSDLINQRTEWQFRALKSAWDESGIDACKAGYIEGNGTGNPIEDEIELSVLGRLLSGRELNLPPIPIGSVKAMMGNLKAASGIAGLIKAILAVHQRTIPPQVNFERFLKNGFGSNLPFFVPTKICKFEGEKFFAGISSFGFEGENRHLVITEAPANKKELTIFFNENTLSIENSGNETGKGRISGKGLTAAVFPGQGTQYFNMLKSWNGMERYRKILQTAEEVFSGINKQSLTDFIYGENNLKSDLSAHQNPEILLRNTLIAQPSVFAVSVALLETLCESGFYFDLALGHSIGEFSALYAAGVFSFTDAMKAVCLRGHYMTNLPTEDLGCMGLINLPTEKVVSFINDVLGYIVVGNYNSPHQTVITGETKAVEETLRHFSSRGIVTHRLNLAAAFHSRIVTPAVEPFRKLLTNLEIKTSKIHIPACIKGEWFPCSSDNLPETEAKAKIVDLLCRQIIQPVDFIDQIERAYTFGVRNFIEIGPMNGLTTYIGEILKDRPHSCVYLDQPQIDCETIISRILSHATYL